MRETRTLSIDYLRKRLRYEPDTGKLFWLDYEGVAKQWRTRRAGKEAFTSVGSVGYYKGSIDRVMYTTHRVAWAIYHGEWPTGQIDHINGVRTDNRIVNLRVVTCQENQRNAAIHKDNSSGIGGVSWCKNSSKWRARVMVDRRYISLGYFDTIEEAAEVRKQANNKYGFTDRHGTPTNVGEACD
jgi:hypothetical protein